MKEQKNWNTWKIREFWVCFPKDKQKKSTMLDKIIGTEQKWDRKNGTGAEIFGINLQVKFLKIALFLKIKTPPTKAKAESFLMTFLT